MTMASGQLQCPGGGSKFFLYAQEQDDFLLGTDGPIHLAMLSWMTATGELSVQVKTDHSAPADAGLAFAETLASALTPLGTLSLQPAR
jgi:hypothetical protein